MKPPCVIIIPCGSIDACLLECLSASLTLDYFPFTIAIIPDAPVSLPPELNRDNISVIVTSDMSISAKRNIAIRQFSDAAYVALIDSDAYPDADWLKNGVAFLEAHPDVWGVGGPNITPPGEPFLQRVVGNALKSPLASGPLYFAKNTSASRECNSLHSCNLILPRRVFDSIGGFDETLFTGEDRNLCDRVRKAGKRIWFLHDVLVYHHNRPLWLPLFRQRLIYGYCSSAIYRRSFTFQNLILHLPLAWFTLFITIAALEAFCTDTLYFSACFIILNLAMAIEEAFRTSSRLIEIPHTLCAIILIYFSVTIGQFLALTRCPTPLKRLYSQRVRTSTSP